MKRSLALLAAFVIASVHQTLLGETSGDWEYTVTDNQATITGYSGDGGAVENTPVAFIIALLARLAL
jgi:hypothetical protein